MTRATVCRLIATGGTIAMAPDGDGAVVPARDGARLLGDAQGLPLGLDVHVTSLFNVPSVEIGPGPWRALHMAVSRALEHDEVCGVVVTHGTDTLEETAWFLDLTLASGKPVVMTGAQRHAATADGDGPRNLSNALRVCASPHARDKGVLVVLNGQINAAREVAKTHTGALDAFQSGEHGLLGTVEDEFVRFARSPVARLHLPLGADPLPRVDLVALHAGADGVLLRAAVAHGARGLVVQALGAGNVSEAAYAAILEAMAAGVVVAISTRCAHGRVRPAYGFPGGGSTLHEAGAVFTGDLGPHKARILLMLALQHRAGPQEIRRLFEE